MRGKRRCLIGCLSGLMMLIQSANAALPAGKPLIQNFGIADYGGHAQNWAIQQGSDGLIYVGGGASLLVYDGSSWRVIDTPDEGRVRDLEIDEQGRIWVASPSQFGYFQRDALGELIYQSVSDQLPEDERDFGETRYVRRIGDTIYFNTQQRLFRLANGQLTTFDQWDGLFRLTFTADDRYYVAVGNRLYDFTEFPSDAQPPPPEPRWRWPDKAKITFLLDWDDDKLLLATYDDGLYLLSDGEPERFADQPALLASWPYDALPLADGSFVLTTIRGGIFHYSADGQLLEQVSTNQGLGSEVALGATVDHQGGLWLSQEGAIARVELASSLRIYDRDSKVANPRTLVEHRGELLIGGNTTAGVIQSADGELAQIRSIDVPVVQESFDLLSLDDGLLVSGFDGVYRIELDDTLSEVTASEQLYEDTYTYQLFRSSSRPAIYVEAERGVGVLIKDESGWRALPRVEGINERPSTIAEDAQGRVWVGTGNGLYHRLIWRDDESLELELTLGADQGVPDGNAHIFTLGDRLVFGTTLGGYRLTQDESRIEPDPLFGNQQLGDERDIFRFYSPDEHRIIGVIGGKKLIWRGQLGSDGSIDWFGPQLPQLDPGDTNFVTEARGVVWIGHATKLLRIDWPEAIAPSPSVGQINLRWAGFPDRSDGPLLAGNFDPTQTTAKSIAHSQDSLRFEYALASYARPEQTQYRVMLDGHDHDWSKWSDETRRDYTNLAGNLGGNDYHFRVQSRDVHGLISESNAYPFTVLAPWYLSRMAWFAYVLAGLLLLWLAAFYGQQRRQQRLLATQQRLETEVAERTAEVRQQARELHELSEAKSRFFANVSHEFRTPLTLAKAPLEDLARGEAGPLSDDAQRYVGMALRSTETMQGLIGQILDIHRLEAGRMPISVTRDDFGLLVRTIAEEFSEQATQHDVELTIPQVDKAISAEFDPGHMAKVVRNLLANALKFTPTGGRIAVACELSDDHVELTVTDTGCGIADDDLPHVFERYYQGDQTHASQPGTGIGLALVRELIELHHGTVDVSSVAQQGTTFTVRFPTTLPEPTMPLAIDSESASSEDAMWQANTDTDDVPTVLVVDDNTELRAFLNMRLRGSYRVLEAGNGEQALAIAKTELPDIVVTDVMMPKMTGLELTAALKGDPETDFIPILMLSARTTRRDTVAGLEQGADDYLSKPFDSAELATRVAGLIASRRKLRQRLAEDPQPNSEQSVFLSKATSIAQEHLGDAQFGPRDWASLLHVDRTTLYRKLKAETNSSPEIYLRELRLMQAAELFNSKAGNVSQIAVAVGFNSISYFSRRFKERFGKTPAAFCRP